MKGVLEKAFILEGIILVLLGIIFLVNPVESFFNFTTIFGVLIVISSIIRIIRGLRSDEKIYYILTGIIDLLFGILVWRNPVITIENLILIYGMWTFIKGIYNIIIIVKGKYLGINIPTILSIISIILGGIIAICPIAVLGILVYVPYIIGIYFIIVALFEIYLGYKISKY
ncbi:DUF308 domain-containing protein [Clostridium paraputrificum]|uniref:DUF308 domain-containing protein n=1 Tax=Clostridium paraputrificum TaxID=29363 RepID=UPI00232C64C2|nr:DUF308 domain-containing protein [Clostridium paraputrificum]MDB2105830.1 DUF308 domain-containing protein [Clostridium paraputrificum]MDB2112706.1 DUF308 domain-containing protein [Clostridium paraputrificum]